MTHETHPIGTGERFKRLEDALLRYGGHSAACRINTRMGLPCECGWTTALSTLRKDEDER